MNKKLFDTMMGDELLRQLNQSLLLIHERARKALSWKDKRDAATTDLEQLEVAQVARHPTGTGFFVHQNAAWWLLLFGIIAVYFLDYFLFRPTIEYIVWRFFNFTGSSWQMSLIQLGIPAVILALELSIASQLYLHKQEDSHAAYWLYIMIGLFCALIMPTLVVSTFLAGEPTWTTVFRLQLVGLTILSALAHILVLFGGQPAQDAKAYLDFKFRTYRLRRRIGKYAARYDRETSLLVKIFILYVRAVERHKITSPDSPMKPGPFQSSALDLLRDQFGANVFRGLGVQESADAAPRVA